MGILATASLFIAGLLWLEVESNPQLFQQKLPRQFGFYYLPKVRPEGVAQSHSALGLQPQHTLKLTQVDFPTRILRNNPIANPGLLYKNFDEDFEKTLGQTQPQAFPNQDANERKGYEAPPPPATPNLDSYDDYKTSQSTNILGPYQAETIQSDHFHKHVPAFDVSEYHHTTEKHGEVHYHQHKHIHKHEHKQEHSHQHKQDHQHKHMHSQNHKHDHHSDHKHGHEHKHEHHQEHKHDHGHDHKHENHHDHKHNHGHKHQHHSNNKHEHKHNHGHKHGHNHKHKHSKHH